MLFFQIIIFLLLKVYVISSEEEIIILIDYFTDDEDINSTNCFPSSNGYCNLRSAWDVCSTIPNKNCIIEFPVNSYNVFNASLGHLSLFNNNISIIGNGASILSLQYILEHVDPYTHFTNYSTTNTNNANQNYLTSCTNACQGDTLIYSACESQNSDTYFRLFQGNLQVASNDDSCGQLSKITYPATGSCKDYCLHMGCYGGGSCGATVTTQIIPPAVPIEEVFGEFPLFTGNLSNTNNALVNYSSACSTACYEDTLIYSSCGASEANTYFRLFRNGIQVAENDDTCDDSAEIIYSVTASTCGLYCLHVGCKDNDSCSANVTMYIQPPLQPRLIYYLSDSSSSMNNIPSLLITNVSINGFGSEDVNGGAISLSGKCNINISFVDFNNNIGLSGGSIYVTNNNCSVIFDECFFSNSISENGGGAICIDENVLSANINNSIFLDCYAYNVGGGAILINKYNNQYQVLNSIFTNCYGYYGGGIMIDSFNGGGVVDNCKFFSNIVEYSGGGIYINDYNHGFSLSNNAFNNSESYSGAGISLSSFNNDSIITGCKFSNGFSVSEGGGKLPKYIN